MKVILIGNPENRRIQLMSEALQQQSLPFHIIAWTALLDDITCFTDVLEKNDIIKIDSYGESFEVYKKLLKRACKSPLEFNSISENHLSDLKEDFGKIQYVRQAYLGFKDVLSELETLSQKVEGVRFLNSPMAIAKMFDKVETHAILAEKNISKTQFLGTVSSYSELQELIQLGNNKQVFIKLAHASSSSGVLAYRRNSTKEMLKSSVELTKSENEDLACFNSLKIKTYTSSEDIKYIIDHLANERLLVEKWEPKASFQNKNFDLRLVVINGKVGHAVMRSSHSPMTNLHLGNERGDLNALKEYIGTTFWKEIEKLAIQAVEAIGEAHIAGVDILIHSNYKKAKVIEVNAFGDLLPNIFNEKGRTTYQEEAFLMKQWCYEHTL